VPTDSSFDWRQEFLTRIASDVEVEQQLQDICADSKGQCNKISWLADKYGVRSLDVLAHIYYDAEKVCSTPLAFNNLRSSLIHVPHLFITAFIN
jgi:predicted 3-demethylubiquinone-9 3-methyltransferase (glyoxalase superfamily)